DAWNKTAAYKMLTETPLGEMLGEVGAQLLDKVLSYAPGHKLNGQEILTLFKHAMQHGIAIGFHIRPTKSAKVGAFLTFPVVARERAGTPSRPGSSGSMGEIAPTAGAKLEKRQGRTLVVIPTSEAGAAKEVKNQGDAWWAENDDLVICSQYPSGVELIFGAR